MPKLSSANESSRQAMRDFFIPSKLAIVLYLLLAALLLLVLKYQTLTSVIFHGSHITAQNMTLDGAVGNLLAKFNTTLGNLSAFLFWACIGSVTYTAIWVSRNIVHSLNTDIQDSHLAAQQGWGSRYWQGSLAKYLVVPAATLGFIAYLYVFFKLIGVVVINSKGGIYSWVGGHFGWWLVLSILFTAVLIYGLELALTTLSYVYKSLNVGD